MPGIDYRAVRADIRLAEVLDLIGWQPRSRHGEQWRGPCPVHGSRSSTSRVFAAHLGKNAYHCFRCGAGGNALDLWAALTHQDLHAAVLDLCQRLNRPVPWLASSRRGATAYKGQPSSSEEINAMPEP
jgi:DNA primase